MYIIWLYFLDLIRKFEGFIYLYRMKMICDVGDLVMSEDSLGYEGKVGDWDGGCVFICSYVDWGIYWFYLFCNIFVYMFID